MQIFPGTLARYFGLRFLSAVLLVFLGIFVLVALIDYVELMRRASDIRDVPALMVAKMSLYRVPQVTERVLPFCVLIGAMSSYLSLSRRLELIVARAAGVSAWQFVAPAVLVALVIGVFTTTVYNPISAFLQERSKRFETEIFGQSSDAIFGGRGGRGNFWVNQKSDDDGQAIINARSSRNQGINLSNVVIFTFDKAGHFTRRIDARAAVLEPGVWRLLDARVNALNTPPADYAEYPLKTSLSPEQVRESFATPETVPFWDLPLYIQIAEHAGLAAAGYKLQLQKLLARPFLFAAMVLLAAAVSLRFFRFGGVQKMILSGIGAGFLLYFLSKITEDLSKAELLHPIAAAWLPVFAGGLTGSLVLLYQEDG